MKYAIKLALIEEMTARGLTVDLTKIDESVNNIVRITGESVRKEADKFDD